MNNVKDQFLEKYLNRSQEVNIITVLGEIYENHFIEKHVVKNYDNFLELKIPISKLEAIQFDIEKYEKEYVICLCNKLIPKINGIVTTNHAEILEKSKSQYPFEVFGWKALDDEFLDSKEKLRTEAIEELTKLYSKEGIEISIFCVPMNNDEYRNHGYFRRISFRFK
jgi:hypothetical protein